MNWLPVTLMIILLFVVFLRTRKILMHRKVVGQKVMVSYTEHNEDAQDLFPLSGTVTGSIYITSVQFFVIEVDKPFTYDYNLHTRLVVKERVAGRYLGMSGEIDVQILLPKSEIQGFQFGRDDFEPLCWGSVSLT